MELDILQIRKIIPHRFPFLLIDRVLELEPNKKLVALKNVTVNEHFFVGHFPDQPVMPGVLQIEAMAQVGGIFSLNKYDDPENYLTYFLKIDNTYCNEKVDKKIWVLWAEGRIHKEFEAIKTPIGHIPKYKDLKQLFQDVLNRIYTKEQYAYQFSIRINKLLEKYDRIEQFYKTEPEIPDIFWSTLENARAGLYQMKGKFGKEIISPFELC